MYVQRNKKDRGRKLNRKKMMQTHLTIKAGINQIRKDHTIKTKIKL